MGQTLTHGIYLPDEGERNCYNGLAGNWSILDNSVGTVAEHTSQIAGKANAVHTHTVSDITDFPALATVATSGSYNDLNNIPASFTPASHTHGNITNDGKVGTDANKPLITGTGGVIQAGSFGNQANTFCEGNDSRLSDARTPVAHTHTKSDVTDLLNSNFIPSANNSYDLGSSSYQWNNLYAKNYYYNGVAWGLDKENTWSNGNFFQKYICLNGDRNAFIAPMWEGASSGMAFLNSDATKTFTFGQHTIDANNRYVVDNTKGRIIIRVGERNNETVVEIEPRASNATLGTSTNKWKTLNGINPGALSLPDGSKSVTVDTTNYTWTGSDNTYVAPADGWLSLKTTTGLSGRLESATTGIGSIVERSAGGRLVLLHIPVLKNESIIVSGIGSGFILKFYPCLGNV